MTASSACTVRPATPGDLGEIARLARQLGSPGAESGVGDRLRRILSNEHQTVLVAEVDGQLVGWIQIDVPPRLQAEPFAEIGGLIVDAAHRGQGIGVALVHAAELWTAERGLRRLRVRSREEREATLLFYRARGFQLTKRQQVLVKDIMLGPAPEPAEI